MSNYENPNCPKEYILRTTLWLMQVDTYISTELADWALAIQKEDQASWNTRICDFRPVLKLSIPSNQFEILKNK